MSTFPDTRPKMLKSKVRLFRYDPTKDSRPRYEEYEVPYEEGARIYSVLEHLREVLGVDLARRTSCRMRICGQCAILVNGEPKLACWDEALPKMTIEPLPNFPVIKDLIIDRRDYDLRMNRVPRLERLKAPRKTPEVITSLDFEKIPPEETHPFLWQCIECLACVSVCPVSEVAMGRFAGPAMINRIAQFAFDPRDKMARMPGAFYANVYDCTTCKRCEEACPVSISMPDRIELTIEKLRNLMATEGVGPLPEHLEFGKNCWETGRVILKREKTLLESLPEEVPAE